MSKRKRRREKCGACELFPRPKTKYHCYNVAAHDCAIMRSRYPEYLFEVFKCACGCWHVGRVKE